MYFLNASTTRMFSIQSSSARSLALSPLSEWEVPVGEVTPESAGSILLVTSRERVGVELALGDGVGEPSDVSISERCG